jgi:hypothetical protein
MFMCNERKILSLLRATYGIRAVIVPDVEVELRWSKKFGTRFDSPLEKALNAGALSVLDESVLTSLLPQLGGGQASASLLQAINARGVEYSRRVHSGEAYTFAAGVELGCPAASNDNDALEVLEKVGLRTPEPTLRFFDFLVFGIQTGTLTVGQVDGMRRSLLKEGEWIPRVFSNVSFSGGIGSFVARLVDDSLAVVGANPSPQAPARKAVLRIAPVA